MRVTGGRSEARGAKLFKGVVPGRISRLPNQPPRTELFAFGSKATKIPREKKSRGVSFGGDGTPNTKNIRC